MCETGIIASELPPAGSYSAGGMTSSTASGYFSDPCIKLTVTGQWNALPLGPQEGKSLTAWGERAAQRYTSAWPQPCMEQPVFEDLAADLTCSELDLTQA